MVDRSGLQPRAGHRGHELLGHRHLHELLGAGDHDVHLAGLAGDDVDPQTVLAQEHLAPVCLLHRDGGGRPGHLYKNV